MNKELYIIGAGSVGGHIALNLNGYSDKYNIRGFLDDDPQKIGTKQFGLEVIGEIDKALKFNDVAIVVGIAFPKVKRMLLRKLSENSSLFYPTLVHERAWVSKDVVMGQGCIIYPGATINFRSEIQDFAVINANCSLGHHTSVGKYSSFAPGVCTGGHTTIKEAVDIGIGVSTLQNIRIGKESKVGGQSMVINTVEPNSIVAGVPARTINR